MKELTVRTVVRPLATHPQKTEIYRLRDYIACETISADVFEKGGAGLPVALIDYPKKYSIVTHVTDTEAGLVSAKGMEYLRNTTDVELESDGKTNGESELPNIGVKPIYFSNLSCLID